MEIRYGSCIRHNSTGDHFYVRAIAPGHCVVLGLFALEESCPPEALSIIHPDELDANFELVE